MKGFIAPTDHGWYQFLRARPDIGEVNFWRPGGSPHFRALRPGEPFFFKLKAPHNAIGGFGLFARFARLPLWWVWEAFGDANGVASDQELRARLELLGGGVTELGNNRPIGCISIAEPVFFEPYEWVTQPTDWKQNIVSGAGYDLAVGEGRRIWEECLERAAAKSLPPEWVVEADDDARHGKPVLIRPRLGQQSFRIAVLDAYQHACAVTNEHSLPAIEAAHIRPYERGGMHEVSNGLPLRRDIHKLFDLGYVTIRPDMRFAVSPRLHKEWENGVVYYNLDGHEISLPKLAEERPSTELLEWHSDEVFLGQ